MERFWNMVHYFVYNAQCRFHLSFNKINPFFFLYKKPSMKRRFQKDSIDDPINRLNKSFNSPDTGISVMWAGIIMFFLVFSIFIGTENLYLASVRKSFNRQDYDLIIFFIMSYVTNHVLLFRRNKYLTYFKEFNMMKDEEKKKWAWISFMAIIGIFLFLIGSFIILTHRLHE